MCEHDGFGLYATNTDMTMIVFFVFLKKSVSFGGKKDEADDVKVRSSEVFSKDVSLRFLFIHFLARLHAVSEERVNKPSSVDFHHSNIQKEKKTWTWHSVPGHTLDRRAVAGQPAIQSDSGKNKQIVFPKDKITCFVESWIKASLQYTERTQLSGLLQISRFTFMTDLQAVIQTELWTCLSVSKKFDKLHCIR